MHRPKRLRCALWRAAWGLLLCAPVAVCAQERAEQMRLIDSPTAGLVDKGRFGVELRLFPEGGLLGQVSAGVLKRLAIGLSFGGERLIGAEAIDWYPRVEVQARYRAIEESHTWPAVVVGYETQGYGFYREGRYQAKSKGAFAALSKNYLSALGQFGVHGGLNWSREDGDDEGLSGWVGIDKSFNEELVLVGEYDLALNDDSAAALGQGQGYLNAGVRWSVVPQLQIGFYVKDLLDNGADGSGPSRELAVLYAEEF